MGEDSALVVVWRVTEACGLACGFCGYDRTLARPRRTADADEVLRFGRGLGEFARRFKRPVHVSWLGGEPLQWPRLVEVSRCFHHEFGLSLGVTTNGVALAQSSMRELLAECFAQLTISIDGLADDHDRLRQSPGLFVQLKRDVVRLKRDSDGRLLFRINTVLMRDNIGHFPRLAAEMAAWGADELTFNQLGGNDRPEYFAAHRLLPEQVAEFRASLPDLRRQMATRGLRILGSQQYLDRISATAASVALPVDDCRPGRRHLFVDQRGRISPCSFTTGEYGLPIAHYDTAARLTRIADDFRRLRRKHRHRSCGDCQATHVCGKFADPYANQMDPVGLVHKEGVA